MTDKHNVHEKTEDKELQRKRLTFLIWAGVMAPLAFSVLLGLLESANINNFAQSVLMLFA